MGASRSLFTGPCPRSAFTAVQRIQQQSRFGRKTFNAQGAYFSTNGKMKFNRPSEEPPKHEMAYFPEMTTSLPSESGEFRRVLWTGLYSQLVLMTVPVGGDIGDEVHTVDQILTFTSGVGKATIAGK